MWAFDYLKEEVGIKEIYRSNIHIEINNKKIYLGHGDGLGPGDNGYKIIKKIFASSLCQRFLHDYIPTLEFQLLNTGLEKAE